MKLKWINHASYLVSHQDVAIICDPWLSGDAFDHSWSLLSETKFQASDFADVTHIWFSHEHPDHFSPPNLKQIPKEVRATITIVYQASLDGRVAGFCRHLGFKDVVELKEGERFELSEHMAIQIYPYIHGDSWSLLEVDGLKLLNLNDCVVNSKKRAEAITELVGPIDILFTQFSNAQGIGNREDRELRQQAAHEKLRRVKLQIDALRPKYVVPFASFIWFSHIENYWHNDGANTVHTAMNFIEQSCDATAICLYPNDEWNGREIIDSSDALARYQADYDRLEQVDYNQSPPSDIKELKALHARFMERLHEKNNSLILYGLALSKQLQSTLVYLNDLDCCIRFDLNGLQVAKYEPDLCDAALSSSALSYCFRFEWGGDTLSVNGRFSMPKQGNYNRFKRYFSIANFNNKGQTVAHYLPQLRDKVIRKFDRLFRA